MLRCPLRGGRWIWEGRYPLATLSFPSFIGWWALLLLRVLLGDEEGKAEKKGAWLPGILPPEQVVCLMSNYEKKSTTVRRAGGRLWREAGRRGGDRSKGGSV